MNLSELDSELEEYELRVLRVKKFEVWNRCQTTLQNVVGPRYTLQFLKETDRERLLMFLVWEQRYRVSVEWMVETLVRFFEKAILSDGRKKKKGTIGFPVLVKTMVSRASEELIQQAIMAEFPNGEHLDLWRQYEQDRILAPLYRKAHEFDEQRRRNPAEFKSSERFS